jgi:hypothetical protein
MPEQPGEDSKPRPHRREISPERKIDERANRVRNKFFFVSALFTLALFVVWFGGNTLLLLLWTEDWPGMGILVCILVGCAALSFLGGLLASLLLRVQLFITDLVFLTAVAGFLLSLAVERAISLAKGPKQLSLSELILLIMPFILFFVGGASWGLGTARRLEERRPFRRIALIIMGWFLLAGAPAVPVLPFALINVCTGRGSEDLLAGCCILVVLGLPGAYLEFEYRRTHRAHQARGAFHTAPATGMESPPSPPVITTKEAADTPELAPQPDTAKGDTTVQ